MSWVALYVSGGFFVEPSMKQLVLLLLVSVSTAVALSAFRGGGCGGVERGAGGVRWVVCGALLGPEGSRGSNVWFALVPPLWWLPRCGWLLGWWVCCLRTGQWTRASY